MRAASGRPSSFSVACASTVVRAPLASTQVTCSNTVRRGSSTMLPPDGLAGAPSLARFFWKAVAIAVTARSGTTASRTSSVAISRRPSNKGAQEGRASMRSSVSGGALLTRTRSMPTAGKGHTSTVMRPTSTGTPSADEICWLTRPRKSSLSTQLCKARAMAPSRSSGKRTRAKSHLMSRCIGELSRIHWAAHLQGIPSPASMPGYLSRPPAENLQ